MIELKIGDLLRIQEKETKENYLSVVNKVNTDDITPYRYLTTNLFAFNDDFMDNECKYEIITVWRFDAETGNFLKIYDKVKPDNDEEKPCETAEPADVPYDKYISLEHEIAELRNIIVELNKKLYGKNNQNNEIQIRKNR